MRENEEKVVSQDKDGWHSCCDKTWSGKDERMARKGGKEDRSERKR